jgi:hypothetical protein
MERLADAQENAAKLKGPVCPRCHDPGHC